MQFANETLWREFEQNNQDFYGKGIVDFARHWAELMEARIAGGAKLEDIADTTSHEADTEGITGFMYGAAVATLSKTWLYGEALRRWHNLATQLRDEGEKANQSGGVLNPALLNIR